MHKTIIGTDLQVAKGFLEAGELVAIPTETVYGLAANALIHDAVLKIYAAKNRPKFNPLILHVANAEQLRKLVLAIPPACEKLMRAFSPGPITYLLPKSNLVPDLVTAGSPFVAIRIPNHPITLELLSLLDFPLAAPSANPSGYVSPVTAKHVLDGLSQMLPYILEGGNCQIGLESTIVGFEGEKVIVHRLGGITPDQIKEITGNLVEVALSHSSPTAPGQLKSHYATAKPFYLGEVELNVQKNKGKKIGIISFHKSYSALNPDLEIRLSKEGHINAAAAALFSAMRKMDSANIDVIIAERFPNEGIGMAINDRLERAAFKP
jgi:L-threonylcarbamoyladenylate synthase